MKEQYLIYARERIAELMKEIQKIENLLYAEFEKHGIVLTDNDKGWIFDYLFNTDPVSDDQYIQMVLREVRSIIARSSVKS
jgi:hypothetical protein